MRYAYLHGFASSAQSKKGVYLRDVFAGHGLTLELPDLNRPSFSELSPAAMLAALVELDADGYDEEGLALIGSSLGGWLAARFAALRPNRVPRLLLLCPAFDISTRWPAILPEGAMKAWRSEGSIEVPDGAGVPTPLSYAFFEAMTREPARPVAPCPTLIVHGREDSQVPITSSREYVKDQPHMALVEVDDAHDLWASRERVAELALSFVARAELAENVKR